MPTLSELIPAFTPSPPKLNCSLTFPENDPLDEDVCAPETVFVIGIPATLIALVNALLSALLCDPV